ncbi:MAG: DsrE/DsrF/TusD sulfur relay family protein [Desulfotomaculales bacterium]
MKIGIVIETKEAEKAWNAFRFGIASLKAGHQVNIFLMGEAVELEEVRDPKFNVLEQMELFDGNGGEILACGTCLKLRRKEGSELCPFSTMNDLVKLVEESDRVLVF